ncbi:alpha/beta hydrolase [Agromyces aureus]|uniref:alpha/beta hydrolase n=1 Tax=Agromyces aureus TaxID=453304 RepID=UPI000A022180|nr:alpha/beta hydrolase fold domain-containing protein [Agromyces aureus]
MSQLTEPYGAADGLVRVYPADAAAHVPPGSPASASPASASPALASPVPAAPALVWAHGGGFAAGDLDMPEADWVSRTLAARGVTVVSVDYRLAVDDAGRYPAGSDDLLAAWAWTLEHADELGIDSARIVVGGASAGANLVTGAVLRLLGHAPAASGAVPAGVFLAYPTLLAVQPAPDAALRALLDANPVADRFGPTVVRAMYEAYLGRPIDGAPLTAEPGRAAASDLAGFPPVLMINGEADELRVSGELFAATLVEAGVDTTCVTEPGTQHGHLNRPGEPAASASIERVVRWIAGLAEPTHQTTLRTTEGITS